MYQSFVKKPHSREYSANYCQVLYLSQKISSKGEDTFIEYPWGTGEDEFINLPYNHISNRPMN